MVKKKNAETDNTPQDFVHSGPELLFTSLGPICLMMMYPNSLLTQSGQDG